MIFPFERNPGKSHRDKIPRDKNGVWEWESEPKSKNLAEQKFKKSNEKKMKKEEKGGGERRKKKEEKENNIITLTK